MIAVKGGVPRRRDVLTVERRALVEVIGIAHLLEQRNCLLLLRSFNPGCSLRECACEQGILPVMRPIVRNMHKCIVAGCQLEADEGVERQKKQDADAFDPAAAIPKTVVMQDGGGTQKPEQHQNDENSADARD